MHLVTGTGSSMMNTGREAEGLAGWLVAAAGRWKTRGWSEGRTKKQHMHVVETITIGVKKHLVLVSCDGERFLVGTGPDSIGTIVRVRSEGIASIPVEGVAR